MALSKAIRKGLKLTGIALVLLIAAAVAIPYFFKDKIIAKVKEAINKELTAKVDFKDVDISLLRSFPKISVGLTDLDVTGAGVFEGIKLIHTENLELALDFWSVWRGGNPYEINKIHLEKPFINVIALTDGSANYNITKPKPETDTEPTDFKLSLAKYSITQGTIIYDDRAMGFYMKLAGLDHSGSGEMATDVYDLDTETVCDSTTMRYGAMTYLSKAHLDLKTVLNMDMKNLKFTLKNTEAAINALKLNLDGWTQLKGEDIAMDFTFKAPSNNFKDFLSIVPAAYTANYSDVKASGRFNFGGFIKGVYNGTTPQYPAFKMDLSIQDGAFQYPKLPMGGSDIQTNMTIALPNSNFDALQVDIPKCHIKLGSNPFDLTFFLRTPVSDPNVDMTAKGVLNLGELTKVLPLETVQNLSGIINADIQIKTLLSYIEKKQYEKVNMNGALSASGMNVQAKGYPSVFINNLGMKFTPNFVGVDNFNAKLGKSDIQASGTVDNILALFSTNKTMTGKLNFRSNVFDANEWLGTESAQTSGISTASNAGTKAPVDKGEKPFDRFDFTLNGAIGQLIYDKYDIRNSEAFGHFTPNHFKINNFKTQIGNSDIAGSGDLIGAFDWLFDNKTLGGTLNLNSKMMDLNQFMTANPAPANSQVVNAATEPFKVPENVDLTVNANMGRVIYTNMDLTNLSGKLAVKNSEVAIQDAVANIFGGRVKIAGGYNTQNIDKPTFKLNYDLSSIDFKQSFTTLNTFQKLAPIGQYLSGKFNTTLELSGELGKDLSPNLNSLNAAGFLQTVQGFISGLKPLDEIANRLNVQELKNLDIKETKNWFEVKNGAVAVKDFEKIVSKDIKLTIGGTHSLSNEMNYSIKARVPRKRLESNTAGQAASAAYNQMVSEAAKYGLNIKNSEFVNVQFNLTGNMLNPKIAMKVLSGDGQATLEDAAKGVVTQAVEKAKDSVMTKANEKLDEAKAKAKEAADRAADSVRNVLERQAEAAKQKAIEEAKKRAGEAVGNEAGKVIDKTIEKSGLGDKAKGELDKMKDKLDKWDPFKKRKKDSL
jgi:hypothetical protein